MFFDIYGFINFYFFGGFFIEFFNVDVIFVKIRRLVLRGILGKFENNSNIFFFVFVVIYVGIFFCV